MKRMGVFVLIWGMVGIVYGQEVRQFRVSASDEVRITGFSADGVITWTNHPPGSLVRVDAVYDGALSNGWATYTHVLSDGPAGSVNAFDRRTPADFALVPAGTFYMGSPTNELWRVTDETQHRLTLTRSFLMQKTEVTNRQMVPGECRESGQSHGGWSRHASGGGIAAQCLGPIRYARQRR